MSSHRRPTANAGRQAGRVVRVALAGMLGVAAAGLVACGASSGKLIPVAAAGPLQSDFEAIAQAAEAGDGNCAATEAAILKAEQDFGALPSAVDAGLRATLRQGIDNLRARALALCAQPLAQPTTTSAAAKTTTTSTTTTTAPTTTPTTPTTTATNTTPSTTPTTSSPGGGTVAPGANEPAPGASSGQGGGTGVGVGPSEGAGAATPGGGQEGAK